MSARDIQYDMDEAEVEDLSNGKVVEKYKAAAEIAFRAMEKVVSECKRSVKCSAKDVTDLHDKEQNDS